MATSFIFAPMFLLLTAFGGTGNEMLDVVDSATYWKLSGIEQNAESLIPLIAVEEEQPAPDLSVFEGYVADLSSPEFAVRQKAMAELAKAGPEARPILEKAEKSDDPEVATAAKQILAKLSRVADDGQMHRLMAIRSLGELKAPSAVPHLEKLTTSKENFVADYATRALAEIRGEKYSPKPADPRSFEKDLQITYPSIAGVFHSRTSPRSGGVGIRGMMDQAMALMGGIGGMAGGAPGMPEMDEMLTEMTRGLITAFNRLGNIRIDSVTVAMPADVTPEGGGFIITARGLYDHERAIEFVKAESRGDFEITSIDGVEWIGDGDDVYLHFASDELLVFIAGDDVEKYVRAVSARLAGKDKAPAGGPAVDLVGDFREDAVGFFAVETPKAMEGADEVFKNFKSLVGSIRLGEEEKLDLKLRLAGNDEKAVTELFTQMNMGLAMGKGAISGMAKTDKRLASLGELMDSINIKREGLDILGEATVPSLGGMPFGLMFGLFSARSSVEMAPPGDVLIEEAVEIAPPVEAAPPAVKKIPKEEAP